MSLLKLKIDNEPETVNILIGPKLGDLFQMMVVPQYYWKIFGVKCNLYIVEMYDTFTTGLQDTYESLKPIIEKQEFTNKFEIFDPAKHKIDIDLNAFRWNGVWCNRPFWAVFLHTAFPNCPMIPRNFNSLVWDKNENYSDYLMVHRKDLFIWNDFVERQYKTVFEKFDKKLFITFDEKLYDEFPLKKDIDMLLVKNLSEQLSIVNGCKLNFYNGTGMITMASALNAPRIGEIGEWLNNAYGYDHLFYDNVEFFDAYQVLTPNPKYLA
jgi:hypothetical protein